MRFLQTNCTCIFTCRPNNSIILSMPSLVEAAPRLKRALRLAAPAAPARLFGAALEMEGRSAELSADLAAERAKTEKAISAFAALAERLDASAS